MRELRSIAYTLIAAAALVACDRSEPFAPEAGSEPLVALSAVTAAPGGLFFYNDGGLTRRLPESPCRGATPHRDFEFWVGEWAVFNPAGTRVGTNVIRSLLDGCLVEENWTSAGGGQGRSMNAYDAATDTWSQYWIDQFGLHLRLEGGLVDGKMVLQGERLFNPTLPVIDRIMWTELPNGDVNQFWDLSVDGGQTFPFVLFNGTYVLTPGVQPAPPAMTSFCAAPEYRRLDFLEGNWTVSTASGVEAGAASVVIDLQGCLIEADLETRKGYASQSFFGYDATTGSWYRNYMDSEGIRLVMVGGFDGDALVLEGQRPGSGGTLHVRVTIEEEAPGHVVERWETSEDGGEWKPGATVVLDAV